ncbi:Na(+) H(+) antiporter subunit E [hydrothermal vent metagenome]|uniref:Na(+) H(+) antiporter subunit E n=1 Tax=hydrothermal vent metagenome TaxID=652676 RepID=A0A3B0SYC6_9ZZZZ
MGYFATLFVVLSVLWLTLSGYFHEPLLLSLGLLSVSISVLLVVRMRILDDESSPYFRIFSLFPYSIWLVIEIIKANLIVAKNILRPDMVLTPRMVRVKTLPASGFGRALFANSITLTPGTVSVDLDADEIIVHSLLKEMTDKNAFAEMARRCAKAAGEPEVPA